MFIFFLLCATIVALYAIKRDYDLDAAKVALKAKALDVEAMKISNGICDSDEK